MGREDGKGVKRDQKGYCGTGRGEKDGKGRKGREAVS